MITISPGQHSDDRWTLEVLQGQGPPDTYAAFIGTDQVGVGSQGP